MSDPIARYCLFDEPVAVQFVRTPDGDLAQLVHPRQRLEVAARLHTGADDCQRRSAVLRASRRDDTADTAAVRASVM